MPTSYVQLVVLPSSGQEINAGLKFHKKKNSHIVV